MLAPRKIKENEVVPVARYILGTNDLASASEIKIFVQKHATPVDAEVVKAEDQSCDQVLAQLNDNFKWIHNLTEEEPPGYAPLANLVLFFGKKLSEALTLPCMHYTYTAKFGQ